MQVRKQPTEAVEIGRFLSGRYSSPRFVLYGAFMVRHPNGTELKILSSDGDDEIAWEHVSVSTEERCPTWEEMDWVKDQFWHNGECVMQLHVPKSDHVNCHQFTLHLWRPIGKKIPRPPANAV